jgi:hypothetical protein
VPARFILIRMPSFVGIYSMLCDIFDMLFIKPKQLRRQCKDSHTVYLLMRPESPSQQQRLTRQKKDEYKPGTFYRCDLCVHVVLVVILSQFTFIK